MRAVRRISVISAEPDPELGRIADRIESSVRVAGRDALDAVIEQAIEAMSDRPPDVDRAAVTLDLIGHATAGGALLRLGDWVIDGGDPDVIDWVRGLAASGALVRARIVAVRLLGCRTAETPAARTTIFALADALGVEVFGSRQLLYDAHYDAHGFSDRWRFLLASATELRREGVMADAPLIAVHAYGRALDLDALPAVELAPATDGCPRRWVGPVAARQILELVRRDAGAPIPGLDLAPLCELAIATPHGRGRGEHRLAQVLLGGSFLRFFPDGAAAPGIAYPVDDTARLLQIVEQLPPIGAALAP